MSDNVASVSVTGKGLSQRTLRLVRVSSYLLFFVQHIFHSDKGWKNGKRVDRTGHRAV